jgi:hypothetical protein
MQLKNPVTPKGINPGTVRLVAQCLNHYATPGPSFTIYFYKIPDKYILHCPVIAIRDFVVFVSENVAGVYDSLP